MSANDQMFVGEYKGKWYVFNVQAESWDETNVVHKRQAIECFKTKEEAMVFADDYDQKQDYPSEYGTSTRLIKDYAEVKIVR